MLKWKQNVTRGWYILPNADSFKRGTVELVVLAVLQKEDLYGYQIVQQIAEKSAGNFTLPLGTLYPVLYRLTESGCISDRDEIVGKRLRKYYHLEEAGKACPTGMRSLRNETHSAVSFPGTALPHSILRYELPVQPENNPPPAGEGRCHTSGCAR